MSMTAIQTNCLMSILHYIMSRLSIFDSRLCSVSGLSTKSESTINHANFIFSRIDLIDSKSRSCSSSQLQTPYCISKSISALSVNHGLDNIAKLLVYFEY